MKQKISLRLSPSKIGQYYDKRCYKNLVSISLSDNDIERLGWAKRVDEPSASAQAGNLWEREICERLKEDSEVNFIELRTSSKDKTKDIDRTINALKKLKVSESPTYLYQTC